MIRRLSTALAGLLTLVAGLIGLPAFLLAAAHQLDGLLPRIGDLPDALLAPGDGGLFLATLLGIGWLCWLVFVVAFLVEVAARIRGVRTPHLGSFVPQHTTAWAITAVLALLSTLHSGPTGTQPREPQAAVVATSTSASYRPVVVAPREATAVQQPTVHKHTKGRWHDYRVKRGDTLWDIADEKLDDPTEWPTIAQASRSIDQPDGRHLTDPDLILPGWTLHIPTPKPSTAAEPTPDVSAPSAKPDEPATPPSPAPLPGTPLRPLASKTPSSSTPTADAPSVDRLPTTPLRPPEVPSRDAQVLAFAGEDDPTAAPRTTPLRPNISDRKDLDATVADVTAPGLPSWIRHPLTAARFEQAPQATRTQVLTVLAFQRGLLDHR